jgi:hypothetical protein
MFTNEAPEGFNVAYVEADTRAVGGDPTGGLVQVLDVDLAAETVYTLTVKVGNPIAVDYAFNTFPGYRVQLLAGGIVLAEDHSSADPNSVIEDPNSAIQPDTWVTVMVVHTSGSAINDPNVGQPLEIRLLNMGINAGGTGEDHYVMYDDVKLFSDPPTAGTVTVELALAVNDVTNPTPVEDTIEIDVYDNPCQAAIGKLIADYPAANLSWLDGDCTNGADLEDFAEIAALWQAGRGTVFDDIVVMAILWLDGTDALTEPAAIDKTPTVSTDKASYDPNETIVYSYSNAGGNSTDWIGLFEAGAPNESELYYYYLNGREHGSIIENDPQLPVGSYEARLFFNDTYALEAKTSFIVQ